MHQDVSELQEFYAGPMGQMVRRLIVPRIRGRWRDTRGLTVMGLGYAVPFLGVFRTEAQRLGALMPAPQGGFRWPADGPCRTVLVEDDLLPLPDLSVDRMLCVHAVETSGAVRPMLREIWRVLRPEGQLIVIVPNRRGLWARRDNTPFGHGQPYSRHQIETLLSSAMFAIEDTSFALAVPPIHWQPLWNSAPSLERRGMALPSFAGVIMVEARKEVTGSIRRGHRATARQRSRRALLAPTPSRRGSQFEDR